MLFQFSLLNFINNGFHDTPLLTFAQSGIPINITSTYISSSQMCQRIFVKVFRLCLTIDCPRQGYIYDDNLLVHLFICSLSVRPVKLAVFIPTLLYTKRNVFCQAKLVAVLHNAQSLYDTDTLLKDKAAFQVKRLVYVIRLYTLFNDWIWKDALNNRLFSILPYPTS